MSQLMRCLYCGILQDEPAGAKSCVNCGGELIFQPPPPADEYQNYLSAQLELDQVSAPAGRNVERHLLLSLRSPEQVPPAQAAPSQGGRSALSFTAVLDVSGSMSGAKLEQAKEAVRQALRHLHNEDMLSLVTFSSEVSSLLPCTHLSAEVRRKVESLLKELQATGMTALDGGLAQGISNALQQRLESSLVLLLSDGQANIGETDLEKVGQRAFMGRSQGLTVSALGVGGDYNEALMVEIATQGGGRFYHVQQPSQIAAFLTTELGEVANLAAHELLLHLQLPSGAVVQPLITAYPARQDGSQAEILIGDLPAALDLEVTIRLLLPSQPPGARQTVSGYLTYKSPAGSRLRCSLNQVTVRVVEAGQFQLREGVVAPVAERVLGQLKSAAVLTASRSLAHSPADGLRAQAASLQRVAEYAGLMGDERALKEKADLESAFQVFAAPASPAAKFSVADAHAHMRATRPPKDSST